LGARLARSGNSARTQWAPGFTDSSPATRALKARKASPESWETLEKDIERQTVEGQRFEQDAQAELTELQQELQQEIQASYVTDTAEQRYLKLLRLKSDLINRVPQFQLASYIGVKPETLSRIRRRIAAKK